MQAMDILDAFGSIRDTYIRSAQEARRKKPRPLPHFLAAIIALVLICALLLQTPMGAAAVETVKEAVTKVIEKLFPTKDMIVNLEGNLYAIPHEAQGQEPAEDAPGFAIYVDTSSYEMTEENGATYIRPLVFDDSLPKCEIEITHIPLQNAYTAAQSQWEALTPSWDNAEELQWTDTPMAWLFTLWEDGGWDARREHHYFVDDGQGGAFHIVSRYFLEAAEGHGVRFAAMIQSFALVSQSEG